MLTDRSSRNALKDHIGLVSKLCSRCIPRSRATPAAHEITSCSSSSTAMSWMFGTETAPGVKARGRAVALPRTGCTARRGGTTWAAATKQIPGQRSETPARGRSRTWSHAEHTQAGPRRGHDGVPDHQDGWHVRWHGVTLTLPWISRGIAGSECVRVSESACPAACNGTSQRFHRC